MTHDAEVEPRNATWPDRVGIGACLLVGSPWLAIAMIGDPAPGVDSSLLGPAIVASGSILGVVMGLFALTLRLDVRWRLAVATVDLSLPLTVVAYLVLR